MENAHLEQHSEGRREIDRMKEAMDALRNVPPERAISAMPVIVQYTAIVGRVEHHGRGEEHYFRITRTVEDGSFREEWEEKPLNAHAVRDEFLKIQDWSGAYDFLATTGIFSPLSDTITWSEFHRWQDFARLVLEHKELAVAMQEGHWSGEHAEVLKALTGIYLSSFFVFEERGNPTVRAERQRCQGIFDQEINSAIEDGGRLEYEQRRELWTWFRRPPGKACSIEWFPKRREDEDTILPKLQRGGAMIEFLLPREGLRPAFVIHPSTTLQAIAATIFADFSNGVEYRTCEFCNKLFPVGRQKTKRFCNQGKCKNAAHSRQVRIDERDKKMKSKAKKSTKKPVTRAKQQG